MSDFLRANNAPLQYAQRLPQRLAIAVADLNEGKTDRLLEPTPTGGVNPGDVTAEWLDQSQCLPLGMAALITGGLVAGRREAALKAKRATGIEVSKLLSWYDEFRKPPNKSRIKNSLARALFDQGQLVIELVTQDAVKLRALARHFFVPAAIGFRKQS